MPVEKNTEIWGINGVTFLEFGKADILVLEAKGENYACVLFKNHQGEFINQEHSGYKGKTADEIQPDVIMLFTDPASIDVVIEKLEQAKTNLIIDLAENDTSELPETLKDPMAILARGIIAPEDIGKSKG